MKAQQLVVALRIRPMNEAEIDDSASYVAHKLDEQMVMLMDPSEDPGDILRANRSREKAFVFDMVFDERTTQEEVYASTTKTLIDGVISGYNATVFAYGPTGAGKTYTMLGIDNEPGIYMQTLNDLFESIKATSDNIIYTVSMSYLEIYNELIRDLLKPSSGFLELREDSRGSVQIAGITEVSTSNAKKIMHLLSKGNKQRTQEPTAANKTSSRSHAILQVTVKMRNRVKENNEEMRMGRLFMIDLAGSERASQTQNRGKRMKEGAHINRSLLALGNCISALSEKGGIRTHFVNFRDSKLTRLLKDSLEGNSRTVMIAHISPASTSFEESRTTLIYAYRAKHIKTRVNRNLQNASYHIAQYSTIVAELRKEIQLLKSKIDQYEKKNENKHDIRGMEAEVKQSSDVYSHQRIDKLRDQLITAFQEQMKIRRSLVELENINLEMHLDMTSHLLTIADWEKVKSGVEPTFQKEDVMQGCRRVGDLEDSGSIEPPDVALAREEISMLVNKQERSAAIKLQLEQRLTNEQLKVSQLEDLLPNVIHNGDQQEVLRLLCKVHEMEVGNTELQAGAMWKENLLSQKDVVIQKYERQRLMCDEIIRQQLILIEDQQVPVPQSLRKLYQLYFRELEEGTLNRLVQLHSVMEEKLKDVTFMNGAEKLKPEDSFVQEETVHPEKKLGVNQNSEVKLELPPIISDSDRESLSVSKSSSFLKHDSDFSPMTFHFVEPFNQQRKTTLTLKDIISILRSPTSLDSDSCQSAMQKSAPTLSPEAMEEIAISTKQISLIAARRRSRVHIPAPSHDVDRDKSGSRLSIHFFDDVEEANYMGHMYTPHHRMEGANSLESLFAKATRKDGDLNDYPLLKAMNNLKKERQKEMYAKKKYSKKRSYSFETVYPGEKAKNIPARKMDSVSDLRFSQPIQPFKILFRSKLMSSLSQSSPTPTKVKFPICKHSVDTSPLQILEVNSAPASTIHQSNAGQNRGQILQKRVKGPSESVNTHQIHANSGNLKQRPSVSSRASVSIRPSVNTRLSMNTKPSMSTQPKMSTRNPIKHESRKHK
ncbi:kinesin-like protein KIF19 [Ambystoma mexicanum]|uniref:kinesin-like protein KIF19 n=1 Tax=Ambystoma mexicanum TaxID=8296 RepID=UPI0037E80E23